MTVTKHWPTNRAYISLPVFKALSTKDRKPYVQYREVVVNGGWRCNNVCPPRPSVRYAPQTHVRRSFPYLYMILEALLGGL